MMSPGVQRHDSGARQLRVHRGCSRIAQLTRIEGHIRCDAQHPAVAPIGSLPPFGVIGLSHKTAAVELRSALAVSKDQTPEFLARAKAAGLTECVVLSTCNRTELYFSGAKTEIAVSLLAEQAGVPADVLRPVLYEKPCVCAACHLFRVTAGLDSAVLGETEIVAQVKEAWAIADRAGTVGAMLDLVFKSAMQANKRIRSETGVSRHVTSTASMAVREANKALGSLKGKNLVVLGAGKIAHRLVKELKTVNEPRIEILNRTLERATQLATLVHGTARPLADIESAVSDADIVFAALSCNASVLSMALLSKVVAKRENRPLVIVDLGIPPNVEPGVALEGVYRVGLEELTDACQISVEQRNASLQPALLILDEELGRFGEALIKQAASPTINALLQLGEEVKSRNVAWAKERLPEMDEEELRVIEELARRMVLGVLESPIHTLKTDETAIRDQELVERLFNLTGGN